MQHFTCIGCGHPTIMTFGLGGIEAAFCPVHIPRVEPVPAVQICVVVG